MSKRETTNNVSKDTLRELVNDAIQNKLIQPLKLIHSHIGDLKKARIILMKLEDVIRDIVNDGIICNFCRNKCFDSFNIGLKCRVFEATDEFVDRVYRELTKIV